MLEKEKIQQLNDDVDLLIESFKDEPLIPLYSLLEMASEVIKNSLDHPKNENFKEDSRALLETFSFIVKKIKKILGE